MVKQSQRTPTQFLGDYPPADALGPTMKEAHPRCKVVRIGAAGWPSWHDAHRLVVEHHYLHAWSAHTLMFAVVVDDFHLAAVAVFGVGGRMLPGSLVDGWQWVDKNRKGQVLELQRMFAQDWAAKGMVSWFLRRCRMAIQDYYPELRAIVVYVAPGAVDRWTEEPKRHSGKVYAGYCGAQRLPDTGGGTEYYINKAWVDGRQMSKVRAGDNHDHVAGGERVGDLNPDAIERRIGPPKRRFVWFVNCDPRHVIKKLKKPLMDFKMPEDTPVEQVISFDHTPMPWEMDP